ncbi:MAG: hypothetical protein WBD31_15190 [Rubripirellula sp.]
MRNWIKRISLVVIAISVTSGAVAWWAVQQSQYVPEFYTRASNNHSVTTAEANRRLKAEVQQLQTNVAKLGSWRAAFSDEQINAWLIEELPQKFPRLAALGASEPRIVIKNEKVQAAVRYKNRHIDTIVSCEFIVEMTEQPNMLAFRVQNLRAGALKLPLTKFLTGISKEAARGDIDVRWDMTDTGPIALVTVPSEDPRYALAPVVVESLITYDGAVLLAGHTGQLAHETFTPRGPVHQFVSYRPQKTENVQSARLTSKPRSESKIVR